MILFVSIRKILLLLHQLLQQVNNLPVWAQVYWAVSSIPPTSMSNRLREFRNHRENRYSQAESPYTVRLNYYGLLEQMLPVVLYFTHSHTAEYANRIGLSIIRLNNPYNFLHTVLSFIHFIYCIIVRNICNIHTNFELGLN